MEPMDWTSNAAEKVTGQAEEEAIPPSFEPSLSIFVPIEADLTKPVDPPKDRAERLRRILESVEFHRQGVRENIMRMCEQERKRIRMLAAQYEKEHGVPADKADIDPEEADRLIASMEVPADPRIDYNNSEPIPPPGFTAPGSAGSTGREATATEMLRRVEMELDQLRGYGNHMDAIKADYLGLLEKEIARLEAAGKRPEERLKR